MIRRINQQQKHGAPPADLLVCFPSRVHLPLIHKKLSSPARLMDHSFHQHHRNNQLKKLPSTRLAADSWDKAKKATTSSEDVSEPSSPKVTCAGQIKVRPSRSAAAANCKSWQSVMEEIERIHKKSKNEKKKASWGDSLGIKKDVMQFLTCLRNIKLDFRCFGVVPECDLSSDEDDEEDDDVQEADRIKKNINQSETADNCKEEETIITSEKDSRAVFSDWFMVVQDVASEKDAADAPSAAPPPPNALLLMRCRSAPAKSWLENKARLIVEEEEDEKRDHKEAQAHHQHQEEEEYEEEKESENEGRKKLRDYLLVMEQYDTEFYKLSNDIAKETWVVGSINPFSRSRSWKR